MLGEIPTSQTAGFGASLTRGPSGRHGAGASCLGHVIFIEVVVVTILKSLATSAKLKRKEETKMKHDILLVLFFFFSFFVDFFEKPP